MTFTWSLSPRALRRAAAASPIFFARPPSLLLVPFPVVAMREYSVAQLASSSWGSLTFLTSVNPTTEFSSFLVWSGSGVSQTQGRSQSRDRHILCTHDTLRFQPRDGEHKVLGSGSGSGLGLGLGLDMFLNH